MRQLKLHRTQLQACALQFAVRLSTEISLRHNAIFILCVMLKVAISCTQQSSANIINKTFHVAFLSRRVPKDV
jgi:hypothetical protein